MCADSASFLAERGLGPIERRIRLGGKLSAEGAGELDAELCLTPVGAFLVASEDRFVGRAVNLAEAGTLRYEAGRVRDRLLVDDAILMVPTGRAEAVRRCIALGRLRHAAKGKRSLSAGHDRYLEPLGDLASEFVAGVLDPDDVLIAFCDLAVADDAPSALGPWVRQTTLWIMTAQTLQLATLSELGDSRVIVLDPHELAVESQGSGAALQRAGEHWPIAQRKAALFVELLELSQLEPAERLYEAARRLRLSAQTKEPSERVEELLARAQQRGHALAAVAHAALAPHSEAREVTAAGDRLAELLGRSGAAPTAVAETWARWELGASSGRALLSDLRKAGTRAEPWALSLHRALLAAHPGAARAELELAEHELATGHGEQARRLAEARLAQLPPDEGTLLTSSGGARSDEERALLYAVLCREAEARGSTDVPSLSALCRLAPLDLARLAALTGASSHDAAQARCIRRAEWALQCLAPGGLALAPSPPSAEPVEPLPPAALREQLSHPLARGSNRFAARLSELIASVPEPDLGFLRDFCEELNETRHPDAVRALRRSSRLFGLPLVRGYVSHGARSVGMRAFGAREPFVLVGQSHLESDAPYSLHGRELDFALGAELAHIAYGHQRVTSSEVWAGAAGKTRDALVALGWFLPVVAELGGQRAAQLLRKLNPQALGRAADGAGKLEQWLSSPRPELALGQRNEELIVAHQLVQLTADRAGLVACANLRAALRAMLLSRSDYRVLLETSSERGLVPALTERERTHLGFSDLHTRVRALVAFYLSPDFEALAHAWE